MKKAENETFRSGFIAIVGAPNAGKSTLLNRVTGEKISITSRKPQTTRDRILGVVERPMSQIIFVDTPGIHKAKSLLNRKIVDQALSAVEDVDAILLMIDAASKDSESEQIIITQLESTKKSVILAINKTDIVAPDSILPRIQECVSLHEFKAVVPISAKNGVQIDELLDEIEKCLPEGPRLFPEDTLTDLSEKFIAGEMIREKIFRLTGMEIPYSSAVTIDSFKPERKLIVIHASIHLDKDSQKGIVIGKGGQMLKKIGEQARKDIERMTGSKVLLHLLVKVTKNWSNNENMLREFGY
ncbi:MAG: GTPase Era [Desulfamplus sp.]|nr:GTPase Era [Desulfamplus sp.]MBF0412664.1 GTPase Era [Desulfamplus sp.]